MTRGVRVRIVGGLLVVVATLALVGCGQDGDRSSSSEPSASAATVRATGPVTRADAGWCPVTRPRRWRPPDGVARDALFGADVAYGNGELWVGGLWDDGVIEVGPDYIEPDGAVGMKFGWWRAVPGRLRISGRRLDAPAPPVRGDVPGGYGDRGFQASGVYFPTEGCWEVTGRVGSTTLTFVTFVLKRGAKP